MKLFSPREDTVRVVEMDPPQKHEKIKLVEINSYLTCYLCKGYLIDATTISECLHSFCRSCIIKFLQESSHCPICEVIINKAKPCLKLDKTLQDIVYKLVPGLFVKEMYRRKEFYQNRPELAPKVSPEERGEDTERTIFNPQDAISLSIEYISDDSAPGAIPSLSATQKNGTAVEEVQDNPMKRYLQCPGMCRVEVLKKFVRNKYNVDTNLFHIDVLYKRVPLPDHYTLIDIGYIYSWKRNEPMKFFFRITDINKVAERFDYFDGRVSPEVVQKPPSRVSTKVDKKKDATSQDIKCERKKDETKPVKQAIKSQINGIKGENGETGVASGKNAVTPDSSALASVTPGKSETPKGVTAAKNHVTNVTSGKNDTPKVTPVKTLTSVVQGKKEFSGKSALRNVIKDDRQVYSARQTKANEKVNTKDAQNKVKSAKSEKDVILKPEITEEIKNKIQSEKRDIKNSVYTNITLNREDNVEIITKIQKVSNKEGQPIGLNIINHTVKKTNKVQNNNNNIKSDAKLVPSSSNDNTDKKSERTNAENGRKDKEKEDLEKSNFLKSIELTAKSSLPTEKKDVKPTPVVPPAVPSSSSSSAQKRKNSSPMKNEKSQEKKPKIEKKPMKIIIQPKNIQNPTVRQMVTNVNQNVNNMSKIVEQSTAPQKSDLQSLIDNCKINIPASLSITLNETSDGGARTPPSIPPVKNYIEILKLPDKDTNDKNIKEVKVENPTSGKDKGLSIPTFQKIFEESIKKPTPNQDKSEAKQTPLDLTSPTEPASNPKRKILEIASQLQKKTKIEQEKKEESSLTKIAIPRLATQRTLKPSSNKPVCASRPQNSASLHSPSLGLNYTVSVGQQSKVNGEVKEPKRLTTPSSSSKSQTKPKNTANGTISSPKNLTPNQLLEKYNIQNLAQLTASFNFNPASYGALQHAMLLKQMEHHSWLNQGPLLQFEKYMQSLSAAQNKIMGNIKEN